MKKIFPWGFSVSILFTCVLLLALYRPVSQAFQGAQEGYARQVRVIETAELGIPHPAGLAFAADTQALWVMPQPGKGNKASAAIEVSAIDLYIEELTGTQRIDTTLVDPQHMAMDAQANALYFIDPTAKRLVKTTRGADGNWQAAETLDLRALNVEQAQGIAVDARTQRVFLLDVAAAQITALTPQGTLEKANRRTIPLNSIGKNGKPRGVAFNPQNEHLYVMDPAAKTIYELSDTGSLLSTIDLSGFSLSDPQSMLFATSADPTDAPEIMDLYIVDQGKTTISGGIVEISVTEPVLIQPLAGEYNASLVQTINCYQWAKPVPDASGVEYWPAGGGLLVSDSEIEEDTAPYFHGSNIFLSSLSGNLMDSFSVISFSKEPTGVAVNPSNGHIFISDDNSRRVHEIDIGADGRLGTADDTRTYTKTSLFSSNDPEGVSFGEGYLLIIDGTGSEVYVLSPGGDGRFNGVAPDGDDRLVRHFDIGSMGIADPEGIGYNAASGTIFVAGLNSKSRVVEASMTGEFLNAINTTAVNIRAPAGVAIGPSSQNPAVNSIYVSDRGTDNGVNPLENDGKVFEIRIGGSVPPAITRTPTMTVTPTETYLPAITKTPTITPPPPTTISNIALNKPVTQSSFAATRQGSNAVDGNLTTYWRPVANSTLPAEWLVVDLQSSRSISRVGLIWYGYYATAFTIDVSDDNVNWTTVYSITNNTLKTNSISIPTVSTRYVRMNSTAWSNTAYRGYLKEFEIYGY